MSKSNSSLLISQKNMALAILQALQMWSNDRYQRFLCGRNSDLDTEWFRWFAGEWNVARTIRAGKTDCLCEYFNNNFRMALKGKTNGNIIDAATLHIKKSEWSAKSGKQKIPILPVSLVSKIGFFLRPSVFVPMDRYSRIGLNEILCVSGNPKLKGTTYEEYLSAFNKQHKIFRDQVECSLNEKWVSTLAIKLDCPKKALKTNAMARKVFDNYLMHSGGYLKDELKQS